MLKGVQKSVMLVRFPKEKYFEEAYFVLRRVERETRDKGEMIKEANRIIGDMDMGGKKKKAERKNGAGFWWGMLAGSLLVAVVWLLTLLSL